MRISSVSCQPIHNKSSVQKANNVNFGTSAEKLLVDFLSAEKLPKYKLRFSEAKTMCEFLGHKVVTKQGSHAEVHISGNRGIMSLVMPHNSEKRLTLVDKKRLILLFTGHITEALQLH